MCTIKIIDITRKLDANTAIYEGDPQVSIEQFYTVENNGFAITKISLGSHSGTHIDAPSHVLSGGRHVADIPLSGLIGECAVITKEAPKVPSGIKKVLIKSSDGISGKLNESQAQKLVDAGVRLIGTDSLSIGSDSVHDILLNEECLILESLDLSKAEAGIYMLYALPLKIDADGSPLRACLIQKTGEG